ncbi:MAG TPA: hypothetical protein VGI03_09000 [Verrucomicrobiae bacterium]|jgi:hypothetical protein
MNYYQELTEACPPATGTMFGDKSEGYAERLSEAKCLTAMMQGQRPFCFLRLGDVELKYLLTYQNKQLDRLDHLDYGDGPLSGTQGCGNPGLGPKYAERLWKVYEQADYVDFHERNWPNEHLVKQLKLARKPGSHHNPSKETSVIFLTWVEREFKEYCQGRRVGFAGAEARILEILSLTAEFKQASADYWPEKAEIFFHQARNDGRNLDANLDLVKEDLRRFITDNKLDTLFLSLGGGAKIIGFELSRELGVCCFDFGAMMRALTYSGCDGNRVARSPHSPFLYRIPFGTYMDVLEKAMPDLTPAELLAKAHGQLILEVVKKEIGWTFASWEFDFSAENCAAFKNAYEIYLERYRHLFKLNADTLRERNGFLHFCGTHRLTSEGRWFLSLFRAKGVARGLLGRRPAL